MYQDYYDNYGNNIQYILIAGQLKSTNVKRHFHLFKPLYKYTPGQLCNNENIIL